MVMLMYVSSYAGFGRSVDVDTDVACVQDQSNIHLYHRDGNKWVHFDTMAGEECTISGNSFAIVKWDKDLRKFSISLYEYINDGANRTSALIQELILMGGSGWGGERVVLSNDYLVYWNGYERSAVSIESRC